MSRLSCVLLLSAFVIDAMPTAAAAAQPAVHVQIRDLTFTPKIVHIPVGATVVWTNEDDMAHTVTSGTEADDHRWVTSPLIPRGKSFSVRFQHAGTFPYFCQVHFYDQSMHGTVVVR